jgi:hypothetical protein
MSSVFECGTVVAGASSIALGIVHLWVPRIFAFDRAIGADDGSLPTIGWIRLGRWSYRRRRSDLTGLSWVMSNAASCVLVSVGIVDLAWSIGDRSIPLGIGAMWIAVWWASRAAGQFAIGRRIGDVGLAIGFITLASWHPGLALGMGAV